MKEKIYRITRFLIAGGIGAFTSVFFLFVLTHYLHLWYILSSIVAFVIATTVSFLLQKFWTFKNGDKSQVNNQVFYFVLLAVINLPLNTWLVYLFTEYARFYYLLSQVVASVIVAVWSFVVYKKIFK